MSIGHINDFPKVAGRCPACGNKTLFLGSGDWVTCGTIKCPNPTQVADLLHTSDTVVRMYKAKEEDFRDLCDQVLRVVAADGTTGDVVGLIAEVFDNTERHDDQSMELLRKAWAEAPAAREPYPDALDERSEA